MTVFSSAAYTPFSHKFKFLSYFYHIYMADFRVEVIKPLPMFNEHEKTQAE